MKKKVPLLFSGALESSKKIQHIVKDLKNFSGKDLTSLKKQLDIEAVVKSAISLTKNMIHKSTRNFKAVYEKNLPNVMGNAQNLEQVIINLVQNSIKYGKENGRTKIGFYDMDKYILVEVADNSGDGGRGNR